MPSPPGGVLSIHIIRHEEQDLQYFRPDVAGFRPVIYIKEGAYIPKGEVGIQKRGVGAEGGKDNALACIVAEVESEWLLPASGVAQVEAVVRPDTWLQPS